MEITYKLNDDDILAAQWHFAKSSPTLREAYWRVFVAGPLVALGVLLLLMTIAELSLGFCAFVFILFSLGWCFEWPRQYRRNFMKSLNRILKEGRNPLLKCSFSFEIDNEGLRVKSEMSDSRLVWAAVERVEETADHIYIYIGSMNAHIIPKWAFETRSQAEQFFSTAFENQRRSEYS